MMCSLVVVGVMGTIGLKGAVFTVLSPPLMAIAVLMPFIGYTFGYIISTLFKLNQP